MTIDNNPDTEDRDDLTTRDEDVDLVSDIRRQWYAVFAFLAVATGVFALYQWLAT